jgi:acyl-CoA synthetase (AMP-forming)/AMP-acid ligase II
MSTAHASPAPAPEITSNIASHLPAMARLAPHRRAVVFPAGRDAGGRVAWSHLTFAGLDALSDAYAHGLTAHGIVRGTRTVLMVKPSLDFTALVFALFKVGAVPVVIDPGIGKRALLNCLTEVEPEAFVGIPAAHAVRLLFPRPFRKVRALVTVGRKYGWGGATLEDLRRAGEGRPFAMAATDPADVAAILFTSGSTGIPKGAIYTHGIFDAQVRLIRRVYGIEPGEIDLATFPLFSLFDPALGMTSIIPDMDARFPGRADPRKLCEAIFDHGCTNMFGSPALLDRLSRYAVAHDLRFPTFRRVLSAGAPVRRDILERMAGRLADGAQVFTPFGATESLPVASIGSAEVLGETAAGTAAGQGICVGRPVPEVTVRVIRIDDGPIDTWSDDLLVPPGTVGEITVKGPVVTPGYWNRPEQTRLAKIRDGEAVVHRMGDLGWFDDRGRLWMCGRKAHRVETAAGTLYSVPCEAIFDAHPAVLRSALVGVGERGRQRPVLVVEPDPAATVDREALLRELGELARAHPASREIETFLVYDGPLPTDVRHNAKIEREKLAVWAASRVG